MKAVFIALAVLFIISLSIIFLSKTSTLVFLNENILLIGSLARNNMVRPLENPPKIIRAVYFTKYSATSENKINFLVDAVKRGIINSVIIDFKDYSGALSYKSKIELAVNKGLSEPIINDVKNLVKRLHEEAIYVIARVSVFQDQVLVSAIPEFGVQSKQNNSPWKDRKGLTWLDPANKEVWNYIVEISKELRGFGIDEVNLDYIRFPSDGVMADMKFTYWDGLKPRHEVIKEFAHYIKKELADIPVSFDLFGQSTVNKDDLTIGQIIEDFFLDGVIISPMVYPSHYVSGFLNFKNPAEFPYEVISHSMRTAASRIDKFFITSSTTFDIRLRPWLQYFDLGAIYDKAMVGKEVAAARDSLASTTYNGGYYFWDPQNIYSDISEIGQD